MGALTSRYEEYSKRSAYDIAQVWWLDLCGGVPRDLHDDEVQSYERARAFLEEERKRQLLDRQMSELLEKARSIDALRGEKSHLHEELVRWTEAAAASSKEAARYALERKESAVLDKEALDKVTPGEAAAAEAMAAATAVADVYHRAYREHKVSEALAEVNSASAEALREEMDRLFEAAREKARAVAVVKAGDGADEAKKKVADQYKAVRELAAATTAHAAALEELEQENAAAAERARASAAAEAPPSEAEATEKANAAAKAELEESISAIMCEKRPEEDEEAAAAEDNGEEGRAPEEREAGEAAEPAAEEAAVVPEEPAPAADAPAEQSS